MPTNDPLADKTPFARLLLTQWAWKQTPPLTTASDIAEALDLNRVTVWQWLNKHRTPTVAFVLIVAQRTGLPVDVLMKSAGYDPPPNSGELATKYVYDDLVAAAQRDIRMTDEERNNFIRLVRERQAEYQTQNPDKTSADSLVV